MKFRRFNYSKSRVIILLIIESFVFNGCRYGVTDGEGKIAPSITSAIPDDAVVWGPRYVPKAPESSVEELPGPPDCKLTPQETLRKWAEQGRPLAWFQKFPEVVSVWNRGFTQYTKSTQLCSGTVVADNWVLTAAHCFLGEGTSAASLSYGRDYVVDLLAHYNVYFRAGAAITLEPEERERRPALLIVHRDYSGGPAFESDLALLRFDKPFPRTSVPAARLATEVNQEATIMGYGFSQTDVGRVRGARATAGSFSMIWPPPLEPMAKAKLSFIPNALAWIGGDQRFCPGDSGGPVLAGRYRGCKPTDRAAEPQPHLVQGVVSYYERGNEDQDLSTLGSCQAAVRQIAQDITVPKNHAWICTNTKGEANGCE